MINIINPTTAKVKFENLSVGDTFINYEGQLCMKIKTPDYNNVVVLENGYTYWTDDGVDVTPVECTLTYDYK